MKGNGCPHSLLKRTIVNTLGGHMLTPQILFEVEGIATKVKGLISREDIAQEIEKIFGELKEIDFYSLYFGFISLMKSHLIFDNSDTLKKYMQKRSAIRVGGGDEVNDQEIFQTLSIAFMDMYILILLGLYFPDIFSEDTIRGYLKRSMYSGNGYSISIELLNNIRSGFIETNLNGSNLKEKLKESTKRYIPEHKYNEPSCPFFLSTEIDDWLEKCISFIKNDFMPFLQRTYSQQEDSFEKFYTGNLQLK